MMSFAFTANIAILVALIAASPSGVQANFFRNDFLPVGHVRTDPIITQDCLSDHVHSFYGPPLLYPAVTFDDLRNSDPALSSGNIQENQSLYWHPAVYHVADDGTKTLQESEMTTVYYNWVPGQTVAFPPGFRMITPGEEVFDEGATDGNPEYEISISFQSCWDGENLDSPDHMSHVAFPDGEGDNAPCPSTHPVRIPRLDFFIRWFNTPRAVWEFADRNNPKRFHADYISGWDESFLQQLLNGSDGDIDNQVTFRAGIVHQGDDQELIQMMNANAVPPADTSCISTEAIDNIVDLPTGTCTGTLISPYGVCGGPTSVPPTPNPTTQPTPNPTLNPSPQPSSSPTPQPTPNPTPQPTNPDPSESPTASPINPTSQPSLRPSQSPAAPSNPPTNEPTNQPTNEPTKYPTNPPTNRPTNPPVTGSPASSYDPHEPTDFRYVVCGRGADGPGGLRECAEGEMQKVHMDELHEVRCCKEKEFDGGGWMGNDLCIDHYDDWIRAKSKIGGECLELSFLNALQTCNNVGGRLCTKPEVEASCTKGTGCGYDAELIWTCTEEEWDCTESAECCSGNCHEDGYCQV